MRLSLRLRGHWDDPPTPARGAIAQLAERLDRTQEVGGSNPPSSIFERPCKSHHQPPSVGPRKPDGELLLTQTQEPAARSNRPSWSAPATSSIFRPSQYSLCRSIRGRSSVDCLCVKARRRRSTCQGHRTPGVAVCPCRGDQPLATTWSEVRGALWHRFGDLDDGSAGPVRPPKRQPRKRPLNSVFRRDGRFRRSSSSAAC